MSKARLPLSSPKVFSCHPAHEPPEGEGAQGQVGGHGAVLEGTIIRIEQVELVVLSGRMHDLLPIDDHPEGVFPFLDGYRQG